MDSNSTPQFNKKILGFDGIRGIAVVTVVLTHFGFYNSLMKAGFLNQKYLFLLHGSIGVKIFFILSGFLITTLLINEQEKNGDISIKNFYVRRFLRIFPLYFLVVGLTAFMQFVGYSVVSEKSVLYALVYLYNFIPKGNYSGILGHTWSLAVEEHFYVIWPVLFVAFFVKKRLFLAVGCLIFFLFSAAFLNYTYSIDYLPKTYFVHRWTMVAGADIALGALLAITINADIQATFLKRTFSNFAALPVGLILVCHSLLVGELACHISNYVRSVGIAQIIVWIYLNQESVLVRMLECRPLRYVGMISYGIYMWQGFFLSTGPGRIVGQSWPPHPNVGIFLLALIAPLSYQYFEKPFLKFKNRFSA